jgi:hypothetical protein
VNAKALVPGGDLPGQHGAHTRHTGEIMDKDVREALQVTKEIVIKFIETSRVSPTNFAEIFPAIYQVVLETINSGPFPGKSTPETEGRLLDKGRDA